jgi:hypothetical protein
MKYKECVCENCSSVFDAETVEYIEGGFSMTYDTNENDEEVCYESYDFKCPGCFIILTRTKIYKLEEDYIHDSNRYAYEDDNNE